MVIWPPCREEITAKIGHPEALLEGARSFPGSKQMTSNSHFDSDADLGRYEALLAMADLMVHHRSLPELFAELAERLHKVAAFEIANFSLYDPAKNVMRLHVWEGSAAHVPTEVSPEDSASGWVWQKQVPLVMPDLRTEPRFPEVLTILRERGINSYCMLPLTTDRNRFGALGLGSSRVNAYSENDVRLLLRVAELVALALENSLTREALHQEKDRLQTLLEVNTTLASSLDLPQLFPAISACIRKVVGHEYASLAIQDTGTQVLRMHALDFPLSKELVGPEPVVIPKECPAALAFSEGKMETFTRADLAEIKSDLVVRMVGEGIQSLCCIPLGTPKGPLGTLSVGSTGEDPFTLNDIGILRQVAAQIAIALDNARAYREIASLTDKLANEKLYLEDEIRSEMNFEEIVGESGVLKRVLSQVKTVAPSQATVLILGETGTGKELIARAIHRMSSRKDASFIKLNCAAIPTGLLESELFGHEKGAFTGAISQKVGRLELADKGTLFLDEVGDIPLELQPKLLRVLQDQEFERLGSNRTIRVQIRLIAATNRDLARLVTERQFRNDLYYRLNVFPIRMPPLRDRGDDIPLLVRYFVQKLARRMDKQIETIPTETMNALKSWHWPGNVRELENIIERSVILSDSPTLKVPLAELRPIRDDAQVEGTLRDVERNHIIRVLRETSGVIAGARGAAARLGLKRTTLQSRMQKMGISRQEYER